MIKGPVHQEHVIPRGSAPRERLRIPEANLTGEEKRHKHQKQTYTNTLS